MNQSMERKLSQFEQNRETIGKSAFLMDSRIAAACACLFALNGQETTTEKVKAARALLKSKVSIFSNFRGYMEIPVACMLAASPDGEKLLEQSLEAYQCLKQKFIFTSYLPVAAIMVAQSVPAGRYDEVAERTYLIYKKMKKEHPLLTGEEDELMCVLLALQNAPVDQQAENCESCYQQLKDHFGVFASGDGVQSLSEVITASDENLEESCQRAIVLYQYFKEHDSSISNGYELGALGALAILPVPAEQLGEQVVEVCEALKNQKGYGLLGMSRKTRMIHAALLMASDYAKNENGVIAAIQGTIAAIIMEEIMIMCIISAQAASSSSNS